MSTHPETGARTPRLNPFIFPSDTDFRFVLLVVSVIGASLFVYNQLYLAVAGDSIVDTYEGCRALAPTPDLLPESVFEAPTAFTAATEAYQGCLAPTGMRVAASMLGGVALLLGVAGAIYWLIPAWKIRRERLEPLSNEDMPEVAEYLAGLCREAGLSRPPTFLFNPLSPAGSGLAFGRLGRYYVALTGGLVTQFNTDRPAFRAVVLHELAHLRNADVNKTYFTVAVWWAFVSVALIPLAVSLAVNRLYENLYFAFDIGWRVLALAVVVYLTRNAVLRAREVYADVRASAWEGAGGALGRVLENPSTPKASPRRTPIPDRWRNVLSVHPRPEARRRALEETHELFGMGFWDAFGTGIAVAIALPSVDFLLNQLGTGIGVPNAYSSLLLFSVLGAALIFAPLMVGVVGSGAWRTTFAALVRGEAPSGAGRLGIALGLGIGLGQVLSFEAIAGSAEQSTPTNPALFVVFNILWVALLATSLFFLLRWIIVGASLWTEAAATRHSLRLAYVSGLIIASGLLVLWIGVLFLFRDFTEALLGAVLSSLILVWPLILPALIALWAFPLAACLRRNRAASSSESGWAFLDSPQQPALPRQVSCGPGLAIKIGLVGGLIFCVLLLVLRAWWHLGVPEVTRNTDEARLTFAFAQAAVAALTQAGVATIVAVRVKRLGGVHGLFAAFVGGCAMTVGILGLNLLFGGGIGLGFAWTMFNLTVSGGGLLALPTLLGVTVLAALIGGPRKRDDSEVAA